MTRDATRRLKKYAANTDGDLIKRQIDSLKPLMVKSQTSYFAEMANIEDRTKQLIENEGVSVFQIPNYLFFAREIYRLRHTFSQKTLSNSAQERLIKWTGRGLSEDLLIKVAGLQSVQLFKIPPIVLDGDALIDDVLKDKTFFNTDAYNKRVGTLELTGNALIEQVLKNRTFYDINPKSKLTGTLELLGNADLSDVLLNKTFYKDDPASKLTGTLELTGNALVTDVPEGKTFYNTNPKTKLTGTLLNLINGLVLWFPLNEGYGNAIDYSQLMNHGTIIGASWVNGKYGKALSFDNIDDYIKITDSSSLDSFNINGAFTVAMWVKIAVASSANADWIIQCRDGVFAIAYGQTGRIYAYGYDTLGRAVGRYSNQNIIDSNWHFIVIEGSTATRYPLLYIDTVPITGTTSGTGDLTTGINTNQGLIVIGGRDDASDFTVNGIIDEIRIYSRFLSATERLALYNL